MRGLLSLWLFALLCSASSHAAASPAELRSLAHAYYQWRDAAYPVASSLMGEHRYDDRLTDYSLPRVLERQQHVSELLAKVHALALDGYRKDDRVDHVLFQAQLESADFFGRRLDSERSDPQLYVNECSHAIFGLLQKEYAPARTRALAAMKRLAAMPALLQTARTNLTRPVRLYASLAIQAVRGGDDLYSVSLMALAPALSDEERARLIASRDAALSALHAFADWLSQRLDTMPAWQPLGAASYDELLRRVLLLPFDAPRHRPARRDRARTLPSARGAAERSAPALARPCARGAHPGGRGRVSGRVRGATTRADRVSRG